MSLRFPGGYKTNGSDCQGRGLKSKGGGETGLRQLHGWDVFFGYFKETAEMNHGRGMSVEGDIFGALNLGQRLSWSTELSQDCTLWVKIRWYQIVTYKFRCPIGIYHPGFWNLNMAKPVISLAMWVRVTLEHQMASVHHRKSWCPYGSQDPKVIWRLTVVLQLLCKGW